MFGIKYFCKNKTKICSETESVTKVVKYTFYLVLKLGKILKMSRNLWLNTRFAIAEN